VASSPTLSSPRPCRDSAYIYIYIYIYNASREVSPVRRGRCDAETIVAGGAGGWRLHRMEAAQDGGSTGWRLHRMEAAQDGGCTGGRQHRREAGEEWLADPPLRVIRTDVHMIRIYMHIYIYIYI
jgi:hypothetical protein